MAVRQAAENIDRETNPQVTWQYRENQREISRLEPGQSLLIGERMWARGDDGRLYYNSQGENDQTFGCLSDSKWYIREQAGTFSGAKEHRNVALTTYFVAENGKVFDCDGRQIRPDANGVYTIPNPALNINGYIKRGADGEMHSCSRDGAVQSSGWEDLIRPPSQHDSPSPAPTRPPAVEAEELAPVVDPSTNPEITAEYRTQQDKIDALKPGETYSAPAEAGTVGRTWTRGSNGKLYYNSQGSSDNTFGCLSDPDFYVGARQRTPGEFIRVTPRVTGHTAADARLFVDDFGAVYNEMGIKMTPNQNGVYRLPNPRINEFVYIRPGAGGQFFRCDREGNTTETSLQPEILPERPQPGTWPANPQPEVRPEHSDPVVSPDRIEPTAVSQQHARRQWDVADNTLNNGRGERLVDSSRFLDAEARGELERFTGSSDGRTGLAFRAVQRDGYSFAFTRNGETWYVSQSPFYRDQYPGGQSFERARCCIWKAGTDGQVQREFKARDVFTRNGSVDFDTVAQLMRDAEENQRSQGGNAAKIEKLDLRGQTVGYVGLVSGGRDPVVDGLRQDVRTFPGMMNGISSPGQPRYDFRAQNGSESIAVDRSPAEILDEHLSKMHEQGIRTFYLNFAGHGNSAGVHFTTDAGESFVLSGEELTRIFDKYSDSRFVVDTVACHGAGFADVLAGYQDRHAAGDIPRVVVKLQSKPDSVNQEGRIAAANGGIPEPFSSYYSVFNAYYLQRGHSIGEAHLLADAAAKRYSPCDAEAWISTMHGGEAVKSLGAAEPTAGLDKTGFNELRLPHIRKNADGGYMLS